jgi:hypothetical protein
MTQATLDPPRGEAPRDPLADDVAAFTRAIWNHQEEQAQGPIAMDELQRRLGWSPARYVRVLRLAREGQIDGVYESSPGRLGYTWELTEEDLRRCEAQVDRLREARHARR